MVLVKPSDHGEEIQYNSLICVDKQKFNAVTKADTFLLSHIDNVLDQLVQAEYFPLVNLASGNWHPYEIE